MAFKGVRTGIEPIPPKINRKEQILGLSIGKFFACLGLLLLTMTSVPTVFRWNWQVLSIPVGIWIILARPNGEDSIAGMLNDNFKYLFHQQHFVRKEGDYDEQTNKNTTNRTATRN